MRRLLFLGIALLAAAAAGLGQSKTGTSAGQFLLIEPSARIAAMGNAGSTMYGDIEAAYYNPAAIGLFSTNGVEFTHSPWLADINYEYAALGITLGEFGNVFASVTSLSSGEIDVRTVDQPLGTGERYSVTDLAFGIGYGRKISDQFSVGLQATYLQEIIWHSSMSAFALSAGTLYRLSEKGLHIGASISNFGTRAKFDGTDLRVLYDQNPDVYGDNGTLAAELMTDSYPLPILFRVGVGVPVSFGEDVVMHFAVDAFHPSDNTESISMGAEWLYKDLFAVRAGWQNLFLSDAEGGLTLGAGVRYDMAGTGVGFDYSWADYGRLENAQRFTLGVTF